MEKVENRTCIESSLDLLHIALTDKNCEDWRKEIINEAIQMSKK